MTNDKARKEYKGFSIPEQNWFKLPNDWTDLTSSMQSWAEHKVVEYVLRHTWGYREYGKLKLITLDEFENGRKRRDGSRMDAGIGMRRQAVLNGIKQAVEDGFLIVEVDDSDKARTKKYYGLKMAPPEEGYEDHTPGVWQSHSSGMTVTPRSEKDTLERGIRGENNRHLALFTKWETGKRELEVWPEVLAQLQRQMTKATFDAWLIDSVLLKLDGDTATIGVKNSQAKEWCEHRLYATIATAMSNLLQLPSITLSFVSIATTVQSL